MKSDIEEPFKKNWKLFFFCLLLLVILVVIGVLLVEWYLDNSRNPGSDTNMTRVIASGIAVLLLILALCVFLVNIFRPGRKKRSKASYSSRSNTKNRRLAVRSKSSGTRKKRTKK